MENTNNNEFVNIPIGKTVCTSEVLDPIGSEEEKEKLRLSLKKWTEEQIEINKKTKNTIGE